MYAFLHRALPLTQIQLLPRRSLCQRPRSTIAYRDTPYYLAPEDNVGQEAFAVIRDAMKKKKMVGIGRVVMPRA